MMAGHKCREHAVVRAIFATHRIEICTCCGAETMCFYAPDRLPVDLDAERRRLRDQGRLESTASAATAHIVGAGIKPAPAESMASADHPEPRRKKCREVDE